MGITTLGGAACEVDGGGEGDLDRKVSLLVSTSMDEIVLLPWLLWVACADEIVLPPWPWLLWVACAE